MPVADYARPQGKLYIDPKCQRQIAKRVKAIAPGIHVSNLHPVLALSFDNFMRSVWSRSDWFKSMPVHPIDGLDLRNQQTGAADKIILHLHKEAAGWVLRWPVKGEFAGRYYDIRVIEESKVIYEAITTHG